MYLVPDFKTGKKFLLKTQATKSVSVIKESNRLLVTYSGGSADAETIAFMSKEEEQKLILKTDRSNGKTTFNFSIMCAQFCTRTITYILFEGKKILISDDISPGDMYIFNTKARGNNECHVMTRKNLKTSLGSLENWPIDVIENVKKNSEKMCLLCNNNQTIIWLENYFLVSELKNRK